MIKTQEDHLNDVKEETNESILRAGGEKMIEKAVEILYEKILNNE